MTQANPEFVCAATLRLKMSTKADPPKDSKPKSEEIPDESDNGVVVKLPLPNSIKTEIDRKFKRKRSTDGNEPKGAYKRYYKRRTGNGPNGEDDRLSLIRAILSKLSSPNILDVGCNDGTLTIDVAKHGRCQVVGVDIDAKLIKRARGTVRDFILASRKRKVVGDTKTTPAVETEDDENVFPYNVTFRSEDLVKKDGRTALEIGKYDVVICLSVTKWVHISHGDEGLKQFFATMKDCLKDNGCLILEPQPSRSYKKARQRGQAPRSMTMETLQLKPDSFQDYLLNDGGFQRMELLRDIRGKGQAFNRPVMAFFKESVTDVDKSDVALNPKHHDTTDKSDFLPLDE